MTGSLISNMTVVSAMLVTIAACLATAGIVCLLRWLNRQFLRLTPMQMVVLLTAVGIATASAQKSGTNGVDIANGTNAVGGVVLNVPQPTINGSALLGGFGAMGTSRPTITAYDIRRGCRLDSVTTNDAISYFIELEDYGKCSVQKLQNEVYRLTNGCVYLNGVMQ